MDFNLKLFKFRFAQLKVDRVIFQFRLAQLKGYGVILQRND